MGYISFRVEWYYLTLGYRGAIPGISHSTRYRGVISCHNKNYEYRFNIYFLTEDSPIPDPFYSQETKTGAIFLPFKEIMPYIDMVRNEKPLYAYLYSGNPDRNKISTKEEPVGEEEET